MEYLEANYPIRSIFYGLSKIQKNSFPSLLRPILAGIRSLRLSVWVNGLLQPLVLRNPGHLKCSNEVLRILDDFKCTWMSCDMVNLHVYIPHVYSSYALCFRDLFYSVLNFYWTLFFVWWQILPTDRGLSSKYSKYTNLYMAWCEDIFFFFSHITDVVWAIIDNLLLVTQCNTHARV